MAKKKINIWKYLAFSMIAGGLYALFYFNGLNLIEEYPKEIGGLVLIGIANLARKWFRWDFSFLLKEETKEKAGAAIIKAQEKAIKEGIKIGVKIAGKIRQKWAVESYKKANPGIGEAKTRLIISTTYPKTKKENPELFK